MKKKYFSEKIIKIFVEYLGITIGCAIMAISINLFSAPNKIAPGGISGLATVIYYVTKLPIGITMLIFNLPLFILSIKILGKSASTKTLYGTIVLSVFIDYVFESFSFTKDLLLASLFGGIVLGIGLGLVFRFGGTTGGTELAAAIINKIIPQFTIGSILMVIDFIVVIVAGIVFEQPEITLYSVISLYVSIKMLDFIQEGLGYAKAFYIISDYSEEISNQILQELDRGVTALQGQGMYTKEERKVLLVVVHRSQVNKLKEIVHKIDSKAFVILGEVHEVLGEGFKEYIKNS
ncbi:YitT family protein [Garciella nitratireducens]|uniref:YitT family protein n=1 Tax=Garciella nitratireducens TaxID=218205 RepID=UPI001BD30B4A|nr:YitT family protein [Garciella nitratireducens]